MPTSIVPTRNSFAASGTSSNYGLSAGSVARSTGNEVATDSAGTAARTPTGARPEFDDNESANPTGTTSAATIAASTTTRYLLRTLCIFDLVSVGLARWELISPA